MSISECLNECYGLTDVAQLLDKDEVKVKEKLQLHFTVHNKWKSEECFSQHQDNECLPLFPVWRENILLLLVPVFYSISGSKTNEQIRKRKWIKKSFGL